MGSEHPNPDGRGYQKDYQHRGNYRGLSVALVGIWDFARFERGKSRELIPIRFFCGYLTPDLFWFRIFGFGLSGKDSKTHPLLFSQRMGHRRGLRVGTWIFHFLAR